MVHVESLLVQKIANYSMQTDFIEIIRRQLVAKLQNGKTHNICNAGQVMIRKVLARLLSA